MKDVDLETIPDKALSAAEATIYADAVAASRATPQVEGGGLFRRSRHDETGHVTNEFFGSPNAWMDGFTGNVQRATGRWKTGTAAL